MLRFLAAVLLASLIAADARACSIPVFRYALERWEPAPYEVLILRDRPLDASQRFAVERLREAKNSNLRVVEVDLTVIVLPAWFKVRGFLPAGQPLPLLALRAPDGSPLIWTASLASASVDALLDSRTRRQITQKLGRGDSAVLVLLESGDAKQDEVVGKMLSEERARLEKETTLPEPSKEGPQLLSKLPLKVAFPVVRLSRSDPKEAVLLRMLLTSEPDLEKVKGPILFAIYGRGRLLAALHGDDLNPDELTRVADFLCKGCSCQVKELNPGIDLLFTVDWQGFLDGTATPLETVPTLKSASDIQLSNERRRDPGEADNNTRESFMVDDWLCRGVLLAAIATLIVLSVRNIGKAAAATRRVRDVRRRNLNDENDHTT